MKKYKQFLICFLMLTVMLLMPFAVPCKAMNTGFEVEYIQDEQEIQKRFERYGFSLIEKEIHLDSFSCYAINQFGQYALGYASATKDYILVYDADQTFLYGYSFDLPGSFYIDFDGKNILFYNVRGDVAIALDQEENCLEYAEITDEMTHDSYWGELKKSKIVTPFASYKAGCYMGDYHQLVRTDTDGKRTVLFDSPTYYVISIIFTVLLFLTPPACMGIVLYSILKHRTNGAVAVKREAASGN